MNISVNWVDGMLMVGKSDSGHTITMDGPGRYREVREAYRIHFHLISSRFDLMARSYDQKTKKVNEH